MGNEKGWAWKECEHCNRKIRRNRVTKKGEIVCYNCYVKSTSFNVIGGPLVFDEMLDVIINLGQFNLTKLQSEKLIKRLDDVFPERKKDSKFSKLSLYLRVLVLNDIGSQSHGSGNEVTK